MIFVNLLFFIPNNVKKKELPNIDDEVCYCTYHMNIYDNTCTYHVNIVIRLWLLNEYRTQVKT